MKQGFFLQLKSPTGGTSSWSCDAGQLILGTDATCHLVLEGSDVAPKHVSLWMEEGRLVVEDLSEGKGTRVNGYEIQGHVEIPYPATLHIGAHEVYVSVESEKEEVELQKTVRLGTVRLGQQGWRDVKGAKGSQAVSGEGVSGGGDAEKATVSEEKGKKGEKGEREAEMGAGDLEDLSFLGSEATKFVLGSGTGAEGAQTMVRSAEATVQYRLEKELAAGGMGFVYRGEDPHLERLVAVKVSRVAEADDPRFTREARVLAHLAHPNIPPIHAMGCDEDGFPFYSMKLINGRSLHRIITGLRDGDEEICKAYQRQQLLMIFSKVCDGISFAHSRGILHRDLKPENIMVGEFGEVLVMDWGLAKYMAKGEPPEGLAEVLLEEAPVGRVASRGVAEGGVRQGSQRPTGDFGMTMDGEIMGTPQYMSPEQAEGKVAELDERSDVYALGGILFSILMLKPPVEADTLDELLTKVRSGRLTSMVTRRGWVGESGMLPKHLPTVMGAEVPEALQAVTRKAMALKREDRYASVAELAADVEAYMAGYATRAEKAGPFRQFVLLMRRHKGATAILGMALLGAVAFTVRLAASERTAHENARLARQRAMEAEKSQKQATEKAAVAHLALAEAAERELDGEEIERNLAEVPLELRDQKWDYLNQRIHSAVRTITAKGEGQKPWTAIVPIVSTPGMMMTLQPDGWVRTVSLKTGEIRDVLSVGEAGLGDAMALSRDGKRVAVLRTVTQKSKAPGLQVEVWEVASGKKAWEFKMLMASYVRLSFSVEGARVFVEGFRYPRFFLSTVTADARGSGVAWEIEDPSSFAADYGDDGKIRVISDRAGWLTLDSARGVLEDSPFKAPPMMAPPRVPLPSRAVGVSGSGLLYATAPNWTSLYVYSSSPSRFLRRFEMPTGRVLFENRVPELKGMGYFEEAGAPPTLVTLGARSDRCVLLQYWHGETGMLVKSIPVLGGARGGWRLCVHPKSSDVAVVSGNQMQVWQLQMAKPLQRFLASYGQFAMLDQPGMLARFWGSPSRLDLEVASFEKRDADPKRVAVAAQPVSYRAFLTKNKDGTVLAVSGESVGQVLEWRDGALMERWNGPLPVEGGHFRLSPSGNRLWNGASVYETTSGKVKVMAKVDRAKFGVYPPSMGAGVSRWLNENRILEVALVKAEWPGAGEDAVERALVVWDVNTGARLASVEAPDAYALTVSPDGLHLAEAGSDMRIRIRNAQTLEVESEFRAHDGPVTDIYWHPKLPLLVSASEDLTVRIWDLRSKQMMEELRGIAAQPEHRPEKVVVSPDGKQLVIRCADAQSVYEPKSFHEDTR